MKNQTNWRYYKLWVGKDSLVKEPSSINPPFSAIMEGMHYTTRQIESTVEQALKSQQSVLLLGPRQTGKTTLLKRFPFNLSLTFLQSRTRRAYELDPDSLIREVAALDQTMPAVWIDEVQKVPAIMDVVQFLIDEKRAFFVLTGSSARKLKHTSDPNLLPGRVRRIRLDPFSLEESMPSSLKSALLEGDLPAIQGMDPVKAETMLEDYVESYLEDEIRRESIVRKIPPFIRFLELAGVESGRHVSFRSMANDIGVAHTTVASYYQILEDCLIVERVDPYTESSSRSKLAKSSRYLMFDLGVRRICAKTGRKLPDEALGHLFEQYVGLQFLRLIRSRQLPLRLSFWKDHEGPEVDWLIRGYDELIPIEVKWTRKPALKDTRHLQTFLQEYQQAVRGFVVCRCERRQRLSENIDALPWQDLAKCLDPLEITE